jgi:hypothetical protein
MITGLVDENDPAEMPYITKKTEEAQCGLAKGPG